MLDPEIIERWRAATADRGAQLGAAAAGFSRLLSLMAHLRSPDGCPWDREQSLASLRQYVREEAGEVAGAIDAILALEDRLRESRGLPVANPQPAEGEDRAKTDKKGHTIGHHPHRPDFDPAASASGAPLPPELTDEEREELSALYRHLSAEIGDLLLQAAFLGDILVAMDRPGVEGSLELIVEKLIRRHPHVYGDREVADSAEVLKNWEEIKRTEKQPSD
jgi:NTP pyrophosphatase (non-canonical NTP hydrolase)